MNRKLDALLVTPPCKDRVFQELGKSFTEIEPPVWSLLYLHLLCFKYFDKRYENFKRDR